MILFEPDGRECPPRVLYPFDGISGRECPAHFYQFDHVERASLVSVAFARLGPRHHCSRGRDFRVARSTRQDDRKGIVRDAAQKVEFSFISFECDFEANGLEARPTARNPPAGTCTMHALQDYLSSFFLSSLFFSVFESAAKSEAADLDLGSGFALMCDCREHVVTLTAVLSSSRVSLTGSLSFPAVRETLTLGETLNVFSSLSVFFPILHHPSE